MPAKENGTRNATHSPISAEKVMSGEEKTAQYAPATECMNHEWANNPRWKGIERPYTGEDVLRLRGSIQIEHTLARLGAERLWELLQTEPYVNSLGAMTGNQAVQQVQAGLKSIYVSGWQVAADANNAGQMYPDQSLYPADSVPNLCRRINSALQRADQVHHAEWKVAPGQTWFAPLVADAEAGFGGTLNAFELKNRSPSGSITRSIPAPHKYRNCREKTSQLSRLGYRANIDRRFANACVHPDNRYLFSVLEESHVP